MAIKESIWETYKRTITPTKAKRARTIAPRSSASKATARAQAEVAPVRLPNQGQSSLSLVQLERSREKALRLGGLNIDAKLDLHGLTQVEAFEALSNFMKRITRSEKRHLLIVTGKGSAKGGVLRKNLKGWLSQLPEAQLILAFREAAPKHGGEGAFYIVLRAPSRRQK